MIFAIPWGGRGGGGSGRGGGWDDGGGGGGRDDDDEDVCGGGGSGEVLRAKSLSDIFKNVELHRKGHFFRIILTGNAAEEREAGHYSRPSVRPSVLPSSSSSKSRRPCIFKISVIPSPLSLPVAQRDGVEEGRDVMAVLRHVRG